jgi:integrase/recombinase XerD
MHLPKDFFSEEQIDDILKQTTAYGTIGIRDHTIFETFYSTGIRKSELVNLKLQDINLERGTLVVFEGKYNKVRVVPIGDRVCAWVKSYLEEVRPTLVKEDDSGYLFLTESGRPMIKNRVTDLVKKYKDAVGIELHGACKLFLTSKATHMLDHGTDVRYIQEMFGHANLSTTQIYTRVTINKLKEVHKNTHPAK